MNTKLNGYRETIEFDENMQVRMYDNASSEEVPLHFHNAYEIIMPLRGEYYITVDGTETRLNPLDVIIIAPGAPHSLSSHGKEGFRYQVIVSVSLLNNIPDCHHLIHSFSPYTVFPHASTSMNLSLRDENLLPYLIDQIHYAYGSRKPYKYYLLYSRILEFFGNAGRASLLINKNADSRAMRINADLHKSQMDKVCDYIRQHLSEELRPEDFAEECSVSLSHFLRLFKFYYGMSIGTYICQVRLDAARQFLINQPDKTILEISMFCGFSSLSSFNRSFKKSTGYTPSEYRALGKG